VLPVAIPIYRFTCARAHARTQRRAWWAGPIPLIFLFVSGFCGFCNGFSDGLFLVFFLGFRGFTGFEFCSDFELFSNSNFF
jgi:hypothetical protein